MRNDLKIPAEKLRRTFGPEDFAFTDTDEPAPTDDFIGQERAVEALELALGVDDSAYHLFLTGNMGTGRIPVLKNFLEKRAREKPVSLYDVCYVHNFKQPDEPKALTFPSGGGKNFKKQIADLIKSLKKDIPIVFQSEEYTKPREGIETETEKSQQEIMQAFREKADGAGFEIQLIQGMFHILPKVPYEELSMDQRRTADATVIVLKRGLEKTLERYRGFARDGARRIEELEEKLMGSILAISFGSLLHEYQPRADNPGNPEAAAFLEGLIEYTLEHRLIFKPQGHGHGQCENCGKESAQEGTMPGRQFLPFEVNLLVDNSQNRVPIIYEPDPTFANLFGKTSAMYYQGYHFTDFTKVKAGSLIRANGGYLILNFIDLLKTATWDKLKKTLKAGELKIDEPWGYLGFNSSQLKPEPIPIKLKVLVLSSPFWYDLLMAFEPDFQSVFKIKAEFDSEIPLTQKSQRSYGQFVSYCRTRGNILPFDAGALARIAEEGLRTAGSQKKLSTKFEFVKDLVVQSDYWAKEAGSDTVMSEHVRQAVDAKNRRLDLIEQKIQEAISDGILLISTQGKEVGQVNGLSVQQTGDYSFGRPTRITARTFLGTKGTISIDREVNMAGPIHNKGVLTLSGYLGEKYGKKRPIALSATLSFEQSYSGIEGDSASAAELLCMISSLSGKAIDQQIAITGSINQKGEIQPIGGVNQKIEGWFKVCKERGFTGSQGVAIPYENVQHLMLREDVVEAVRAGQFSIWQIKTIDDGIEKLMGKKASVVHKAVQDRLDEMFKKIKDLGFNK